MGVGAVAGVGAGAGTGAGALPRIKRREVAANWMLGGLGVVLAVVGGAVAAKGW